MAEIAVNLVIDKLGPLLVQDVKLLKGVRKEIEDIKTELESIRCFLKDAEAMAAAQALQGNSSGGVELLVSQVREVAYCIEDVIDEFAFTVDQPPRGRGLYGVLQRINHSLKKLKLRYNIACDIQDIKSSLVMIEDRRKRYGFYSIEQGSSSERRNILRLGGSGVGSYYTEEDQIVGYESLRNEVNEQLVNRIPQRRVIALVGAGGLGKTTLAASAYKNEDVSSHFNCHAWIYVGKTYIMEDLLRRMVQKFYSLMEESAPGNIETMDEMGLTDMLRKYLKDKSYLVAFDDVWKDEFWEEIKHALPNNNKSSRLIITARNRGVAHFIPASIVQVFKLEGLPSGKAWQLFCRKAFNSDGFCPPELEELSNKILEKCGGLPLAIVAVGGLLSKKNKTATEWQKLLDNLGSELGSDPHLKNCNRVLSEAYNDLPHHLKPCLLYFGLFPESYSISGGKLTRLWIAEGFVQFQGSNSREPEEIGEGYMAELTHRNLVQVSTKRIYGGAKRFRVHDLMHEIIFKKAKQLGHGGAFNEDDMSQSRKVRRLTIHKSSDTILKKINDSKVRSIIFFDQVNLPQYFINALMFVSNFKLMKVLDFEDALIDYLHKGVGNLFHLHYLSLRNTKVKVLPKTIGKLVNLETLDLKYTLVSELPIEIKYLKKLRYLWVYRSNRPHFSYGECTKIRKGFGSLIDLRKLSGVQVNSEALEELRKLRQLRKLGIQLVNGYVQKYLYSSLADMNYIKSLTIELINREDILDLESMASPPTCLERLYLKAHLKKLPYWISNLQNLVRLYLVRSYLTEDPLRLLHTLPNLLELYLVEAYSSEELRIKQDWFPKLQVLFLKNMNGLRFIRIEDGAPLLESLLIMACPLLKEIPSGIENLRNLKQLFFRDMLKEIASNSLFVTHETLEKLKHVPTINASAEVDGGQLVVSVKDILNWQLESSKALPEKEGIQYCLLNN